MFRETDPLTKNPDKTYYNTNDTVQLLATPAEGWEFKNWEGDLIGTNNPDTLLITGNKNVTAIFEDTTSYQINISISGNGSVIKTPDSLFFHLNDTLVLFAEADEGWIFTGWEGDITGTDNPDTLFVSGNMNITAVFEIIEFYINIDVSGNGYVTKNPDQSAYLLNDILELTATAGEDWEFLRWEGDVISMDNPLTIIVTADMNITAVFDYPFNKALSFDGTTDYLNVPYSASMDMSNDFTVETWLYPTEFIYNQWKSFINRGDIENPDYSFWLGFFGDKLYFDFKSNYTYYDLTTTETFPTDSWMHVALVYQKELKQATFYVNGTYLESKVFSLEVPANSNAPLRIGGDPDWSQYFSGRMDDVRIWNTARTEEEIRREMYHELPDAGTMDNLVAYYDFDEEGGQFISDHSPNNNAGTLGANSESETADPERISSTAPIPYFTVSDGTWDNSNTWAEGQGVPLNSWSRVKITNNLLLTIPQTIIDVILDNPGVLTINAGQTLGSTGSVNINSGGLLVLNTNSTLVMGNESIINVNSGGALQAYGASGNETKFTHTTGYYEFNINDGGSLSAENSVFEYMDSNGVAISGAIDPAYPLRNCTFQNGQAGGTLITFNSAQTVLPENVIFPANTWEGGYNVSKTVNAGYVNFINATGEFSGPGYENDLYNRIDWGSFDLQIKVFLEGPFNGTNMDPGLTDLTDFPLNQPYFDSPWNYNGTENVATVPPDVVDWVLVELRDASDATSATSATTVARQAAFLMSDGTIRSIDGLYNQQFNNLTIQQLLFVVIRHRNHLAIMSSTGLIKNSSVYSYDFTTGAEQAYGMNAQKEIGTNIWGMISGDSNADNLIDVSDKTSWEPEAGKGGYLNTDFNLNGNTDNRDKNDFWLPNNGEGSQVPE